MAASKGSDDDGDAEQDAGDRSQRGQRLGHPVILVIASRPLAALTFDDAEVTGGWMRRLVIVAALVAAWAGLARAEDAMLAFKLGDVLGSEKACGLQFDQDAIRRFIETNASAGDMGFTGDMNGAAEIMADRIARFTQSQRTAHCTQIGRVAKANGFVD